MPISTIPSAGNPDSETDGLKDVRKAEKARGKLLKLKQESRQRVSEMTFKPVPTDVEPANSTEPEFSVYANEGDEPAENEAHITEISASPEEDERVCEDFGFEEDEADLDQLEDMSREDVSAVVAAILAKARDNAK